MRHLLAQTVEVRAYVGETAHGPLWADAVTVLCRLEDGNELVRTAEGDEVTSTGRLFLQPDVLITPESLVVVDDRERTVLTVEKVRAATTLHHLEVTLR